MFLLKNLTRTGYDQIKKDRDELINKIKAINILVSEIELALPYLESIFEPKIKIYVLKSQGVYRVSCNIIPNDGVRIRLDVKVATLADYDDINDPKLILLAQQKIKKKIKSSFPQHFKDEDDETQD
jgi:hypothetical protein